MDVVALNNRERERRRQPGRNMVTNQHSSYTDAVIQKYDLEARWSPQAAGLGLLYRRGVYDPPELKPVWRRPHLTQVLEDTVGFGPDQI